MEITFDSIVSVIGLLLGGGSLGSLIMWQIAKKKANAEASKAEAEANKAEAEAAKEKQDYYQQMMDDMAKDRDYYKQERDEYRRTIKSYDERIDDLERKVARNGRIVESLRPFICTDLKCQLRHRAVISENGEIEEAKKPKKKKESNEIEPINNTEL